LKLRINRASQRFCSTRPSFVRLFKILERSGFPLKQGLETAAHVEIDECGCQFKVFARHASPPAFDVLLVERQIPDWTLAHAFGGHSQQLPSLA
jgi:hypothetical protein